MIRIIIHALLFIAAGLVFFVGLGVGLQVSPTLGTILWLTSAAIVILNLLWMFKNKDKLGIGTDGS